MGKADWATFSGINIISNDLSGRREAFSTGRVHREKGSELVAGSGGIGVLRLHLCRASAGQIPLRMTVLSIRTLQIRTLQINTKSIRCQAVRRKNSLRRERSPASARLLRVRIHEHELLLHQGFL